MNAYKLFALVQHEGSIDTGHYRAYCRQKNDWFCCDDDVLTRVDQQQVLKVSAYMCFYIRQHAQFVPSLALGLDTKTT